jgi:hypothetical protein
VNRQEVLDSVRELATEQEQQWMFDLGAQLTVSARGAYTVQETSGDVLRLMGFNELQHQITGVCENFVVTGGGLWKASSMD